MPAILHQVDAASKAALSKRRPKLAGAPAAASYFSEMAAEKLAVAQSIADAAPAAAPTVEDKKTQ